MKFKLNRYENNFAFRIIEYGRSCKDIGCLPSETCILAQDSCSYHQTEGKECGSYPKCSKNTLPSSNSPGNEHLIFIYFLFSTLR